jgi:spore photoproduct lyase
MNDESNRLCIKKIIIHPDAAGSALARRVTSNCGDIPLEIAERPPDVPLYDGKQILFLARLSGRPVKACPGTQSTYLCCQYRVIHSCSQCPMDCTYCVLQEYLESPVITLDVRLPEIFQSVKSMLADQPRRFFRFGTGELGDSLALDSLTGLSENFIRFFTGRKNALIELKTKSVNIDGVLKIPPGHSVLSWSVNPDPAIRTQEFHTPHLQARIEAARQCMEKGYVLGFHFDPILHIPDWENLYCDVVHQIFSSLRPERIAWISLGSLRFPPALKPVIESRFPRSRITDEEMIRGMDGKMRYPKPMRIGMYKSIYQSIRAHNSDVFVYFCMESPQIWDRVTGSHPADNSELDFRFAESLWRRFGREIRMNKPEPGDYTIIK